MKFDSGFRCEGKAVFGAVVYGVIRVESLEAASVKEAPGVSLGFPTGNTA